MTNLLLNAMPGWMVAALVVLSLVGFTAVMSALAGRRWLRDVEPGYNEVTGLLPRFKESSQQCPAELSVEGDRGLRSVSSRRGSFAVGR